MSEHPDATQCTGAILVGGRARRLGGVAKGLIGINGDTPIGRQVKLLRPRCHELFLVGHAHQDYAALNIPVVPDMIHGRGSPGGVHAALHHSPTPWVMVLACDMPNLTAPLLDTLLEKKGGADVIMYRSGERVQPLVSIWHQRSKPLIAARLRARGCGFKSLLECLHVELIDHPCPSAFANLNTPADVAWYRKRSGTSI